MDIAEVLARYDREERQDVEEAGMHREALPGVVRLVDQIGTESAVIYSQLDAQSADLAIRREVRYFDLLGHSVEWKLYSHDAPPDLGRRLEGHGFTPEEPEAVMVLDLAQTPDALLGPVPACVRRITHPSELQVVTRVREAVWPGEHGGLEERLSQIMSKDPERLSVYVGYADGLPVSAGRIQFSERSAFAGLWGGATLEEHRGQGFYTALLKVRVQEAIRRGARYLTIDASPMSRPIVEKYGFRLLTFATAHLHRAAGKLSLLS